MLERLETPWGKPGPTIEVIRVSYCLMYNSKSVFFGRISFTLFYSA